MQFCSCLLFSGLLSIALLHCSVDSFRVQHRAQLAAPGPPGGPRPRPAGLKRGEELTVKLLRTDDRAKQENDVMEPKRKRSFPGGGAPLDRLSVGSVETKQAASRQSKVVELPRRRVSPPPIDRISMSRLPSGRG